MPEPNSKGELLLVRAANNVVDCGRKTPPIKVDTSQVGPASLQNGFHHLHVTTTVWSEIVTSGVAPHFGQVSS